MAAAPKSNSEYDFSPQTKSNPRIAFAVFLFLMTSCASTQIENRPLTKFEQGAGYGAKFNEIPNESKLRVILAFSGGGTRASALAYGVLKELRETEVEIGGTNMRLLDQVSTISSVSGGSFTAAYYGLHGEGIFEDYEERFLRYNFAAGLAYNLLRPFKLLRIAFTSYSRSDMAIDLYDKVIFDGATFADLEKAGGPMLNINATDIGRGTVFTFIQPVFDLICSDLSQMRIAQAVTASSAVPGIFPPLLLENHAGTCDCPEPLWIAEALANPSKSRRRYHAAREASTYLDREEQPYIFLLDGGVADNIGARRLMAEVTNAGGVSDFTETKDIRLPEYIMYIVVNAQVSGNNEWQMNPVLPSIRSVLSSISGTGIYRYNFETIQLLHDSVTHWSREAEERGETVKPYVVEVAFNNLEDPKERKFFNGVKTTMNLDDESIARLIEVGGRLLRESPDFKDFLEQAK
jgi:NTE family protein